MKLAEVLMTGMATVVATACSPSDRNERDDLPVDAAARPDGSHTAIDAPLGTTPDAPVAQPTVFPIQGANPASPVIASLTVSCHAMYSPRILRVYVVVTDPQGANDRGAGSSTLLLPDGTQVAVELREPFACCQYDERVKFGTGVNLTVAQFDQACAASTLTLTNLTLSDNTGHVTAVPQVIVAPMVGGSL